MNRTRSHRVRDFDSLRRWLLPRLDSFRCISFDVFDTLLARCIEPPDALQHRAAALLAQHIGEADVNKVLRTRKEAEAQLRQASFADGMDHECHFDPLVEAWLKRLTGTADPALVDFVHGTERMLESVALFAKPGVAELLDWLRASGKRLIAVSDMYLSHDHLVSLLGECGLAHRIDRVYVSSEFGLGKYSGRLHAKVLELEGLGADDLIHLGDNHHSDMRAPSSLGIRSVFLDERHERLRRRRQALSHEMAHCGGIWPGRQFFEVVDYRMCLSPLPGERQEEFFEHYGANVLGPAFSTFLLGLTEKIRTVRPDKVFFLARDGYLFQEMYRRWRELEPAADWPEAVYAYASRRVVAAASVAAGLSHDQALVGLYNPKQQGLHSILRTFDLDPEMFADLAKDHGFHEMAAPLADWHDPRLIGFLDDERVQARIRPIGSAAREKLQRYFEQLGLFDCERAAFVDIGWNGTIQKFLRESFAGRPDYPDIHGWYFAFVGAMHGDFGVGDRIDGLVLDARRGDMYERAPMDFEEIFEQAARAPEGTTLTYRDQDGRVVPILKDESAPDRLDEIACNPLIARLQAGIMHHLVHFHAAWRLTGYRSTEIKPYVLGILERAVAYPDKEEVAQIGRLVHTEDFGHDHTLDISIPPVRAIELIRPRTLIEKLRRLPWKFAAFAGFSSRLPAWLFRFYFLMKKRVEG